MAKSFYIVLWSNYASQIVGQTWSECELSRTYVGKMNWRNSNIIIVENDNSKAPAANTIIYINRQLIASLKAYRVYSKYLSIDSQFYYSAEPGRS